MRGSVPKIASKPSQAISLAQFTISNSKWIVMSLCHMAFICIFFLLYRHMVTFDYISYISMIVFWEKIKIVIWSIMLYHAYTCCSVLYHSDCEFLISHLEQLLLELVYIFTHGVPKHFLWSIRVNFEFVVILGLFREQVSRLVNGLGFQVSNLFK